LRKFAYLPTPDKKYILEHLPGLERQSPAVVAGGGGLPPGMLRHSVI